MYYKLMENPNSSSRQELSGTEETTEEEDGNRDSTKKSKRESAGYLVWYRHSGEESIESIPDEPVLQRVRSEEEVLSDIGSHYITHLVTEGEVPDLSTLSPHLQQLRIRQLTNPAALGCFSFLAKLETLDISRNNFSDGLPDIFTQMSFLKELNVSRCGLTTLPQSFSFLAKLETLDIRDNNFSGGLPDVFTQIRSLKELDVSLCGLTTLPQSFSSLTKLEKLDIGDDDSKYYSNDNNFSDGLPDIFTQMKSLKELNVRYCGLTTLPQSFSFLANLETLNIRDNNFSDGLPDIFTEMRSLKELNVSWCKLTTLPQSFSFLTKLETLAIRGNNFSDGLPDIFTQMGSLKKLYVSACCLRTLPQSFSFLTKLETLAIRDNNFSDGLPDVFTEMRSLKELNVSGCSLTTLPQSIDKLTRLETLNLSINDLEELPAAVYSLSALKTLNISRNESLKTISQEILQLTNLTTLDYSYCDNLDSPPQAVRSQGWLAIHKFFLDLEAGSTLDVSVAPVAVLGATMGGKTSLVRSLQARERRLTERGGCSALDEATRVFKIEDLQLNDSLLKFIDLGGHRVYHLAYQLTLKDKCVPLLVVNMKEFNDIVCRKESKEATRQLCFSWLAHVYLSCPKLGPPILVLTHKDQLSDEIFALRRIQLLDDVEEVRQLVLEEEKSLYGDISDFCKIEHLSDTSLPVFAEHDIFVFSDDQTDNSNIIELLNTLELRCNDFRQTIPALWDRVSVFVERQTSQTYIRVSDITTEFPDCDVLIVLRYLHNIGKILWFEKLEGLSMYIFHQIEAITNLVSLLFNHTANADWSHRIKQFSPYKYQGRFIYKAEYEQMVRKFLSSGEMDEAIMSHLLEVDTRFPPQVALQLLRSFFLIHGPVRRDLTTTYIIPYFSTQYIDRSWKFVGRLQLRMEIEFHGLAIPEYIYQLMSVEVLSFNSSPTDITTVFKNGVSVRQGRILTQLVHDYNNSKVNLQVSTTPELIGVSWQRLLDTIQYLLTNTTNIFRAARPVCGSFCSHCLFLRERNPDIQINPGWFQRRSHTDGVGPYSITPFTGTEAVECCNTNRNEPTVLKPLRFPCFELTAAEISKVKDFLSRLKPHRHTPAEGADDNIPRNADSDSDLSDDLDFLDDGDDSQDLIDLQVKPCSRARVRDLFTSESVYGMSGPIRGRCLIINNKIFDQLAASGQPGPSPRPGSEKDVENLQRVFGGLSFEVDVKTDLSIQEMTKAVIKETKHRNHARYGMFVLVIMSHGAENTVCGRDGWPLSLSGIYALLSPSKFAAMAGKPKVIIIQACSGGRKDTKGGMFLDPDVPVSQPRIASAPQPPSGGPVAAVPQSGELLDTDDFYIMKASFPGYVSGRHSRMGTWFIRALVEALYKHACHRDLESLFKQVQNKVRKKSLNAHGFSGQKPTDLCAFTNGTFTERRKLHLFPGYDPPP